MAGGICGVFFKQFNHWFSLGGLPCLVITLLIEYTSFQNWLILFAVMGFFAGLAIIGWGTSFAQSVPFNRRGRVFAINAIIANLILYFAIIGERTLDNRILLVITSLLTFAMPGLTLYRKFHNSGQRTEAPAGKLEVESKTNSGQVSWSILPFILAIYAVGGLMYDVIRKLGYTPSDLLSYLGLVPYIVFLPIAGSFADSSGRRIIAILGAIAVGTGFMSVGLLRGPVQYLTVQTFLIGGYAFLDTFTWVIASDLSFARNSPLAYSIILGINVLAIMIGVLLGDRIGEFTSGAEVLTVSLAGIFSFISLLFVIKLKDTFQPPDSVISQNINPIDIDELFKISNLTSRETEIARLLVKGCSTEEIRQKLVIAPDTLKTHLRNIYRKTGVRNRLEFTLLVMKSTRDNPNSANVKEA
ncbi:MAG: LuxR C-terminal-related transcriptional regulator [Dehalococcoidales bacterium]|nr:LuxR C-terminal-related transcriptional regulator [Dehalococcoidales bacterium]